MMGSKLAQHYHWQHCPRSLRRLAMLQVSNACDQYLMYDPVISTGRKVLLA